MFSANMYSFNYQAVNPFNPFGLTYPAMAFNDFSGPTRDSHTSSIGDGFNSAILEFDLKNIWKEAESALVMPVNTNNSGLSPTRVNCKKWINSEPKMRTIIGRGADYYERFGNECVAIPQGEHINYPPNRSILAIAKNKSQANMECAFCKNMKRGNSDYKSHWLKNSKNQITCPVLRAYVCPLCNNQGGDQAHTMRYCPLKREKLAEEFRRVRDGNFHGQQESPKKIQKMIRGRGFVPFQ